MARRFAALLLLSFVLGAYAQEAIVLLAEEETSGTVPDPEPPVYEGEVPTYGEESTGPNAILTGGARFFGPLAAGCQATFFPEAIATTTTLGAVGRTEILAPNRSLVVIPTCTDRFTGVAIPYAVAGTSYGDALDVGVVPSIGYSNVQAVVNAQQFPTPFSYYKAGLGNVATDDDVFAKIRAGQVDQGVHQLSVELRFIIASSLVAGAMMNATSGTATCATPSAFQQAFASNVGGLPQPAQLAYGNRDQLVGILQAFSAAPCFVPSSTLAWLVPDLAQVIANAMSVVDHEGMDVGGSVFAVTNMAKIASFVSTTPYTTIAGIQDQDAGLRLIDAAPIVPSEIVAALGIPGYSAVDTTVKVQSVGPLTTAQLLYQPFTSGFNSSFTTNTEGKATITGATFGMYLVPAGATDSFLTADPNTPIKTKVPIIGVAGFTPVGFTSITVNPISTLVLFNWLKAQHTAGARPAVPVSADWRAAYEGITGPLPEHNYLARDYPNGSGAALAVFSVDAMVPSIPTLGALFISKAIPNSDVLDILARIYLEMAGKPAAFYTTPASIVAVLKAVYVSIKEEMAGPSQEVPVQGRRRLTQSLTELEQLTTILTSLASSISETNVAMQTVLAEAKAAIVAGTTPPAAAFVQISKVASVQSEQLSAQIVAIANLVATGNLATAVTQAAAVQAAFTGDALTAAISAAAVNTKAIELANQPTTTTESKKSNTVAIAVGVAVGVGGALLIALALFLYIRKRRADQATAPAAATAEAAEEV